jgi:predicted KAP-like P-loop ATPase
VGDPLAIIADTPSTSPGLGFRVYAEALADAIRGGRPAQFTIGIYGPWGSGKSSILNYIFSMLKRYENVIPVMFDAWHYEGSGPIIVPMLHSVAEAAEKHSDPRVGEQVRKALSAFVYSTSYSPPDFGLDMSKFRDTERSNDLAALDDAFARPFRELKGLASVLQGHRFAVLIDDLDRCSPKNVVAMLETINVIMDVPGLVFVIALDYDVLIKAINEKYPHVSGHSFVEKLVQVPFRIPRLRLYADSFLSLDPPTN